MRVDAPEQELVSVTDGQYRLEFRPQLIAEQQNAAMSLAANLAIADELLAHHTGLFRVMPELDDWAVKRLRRTAKALGLAWPANVTLKQFEAGLNSSNPRDAAFQAAIRRSGPKASYAPFREGEIPWHTAMGATYAHVTAPLRRLADRYVIQAALLICSGQAVPDELNTIFQRLPDVMARAEDKAGQIDRAVLDLAEAVMLEGQEGSQFEAIVTDLDERGSRIQLSDPAVVARIDGKGAMPGDAITVELVKTDVAHRQVVFQRET
jgi:exoribonuclease R